jgi:hypothetical protein
MRVGCVMFKHGFGMDADEIEHLDVRIADLRDSVRRSHRLILAGRAGIVLGLVIFAGLLVGVVDFAPARMVVVIALAIGGVVLTGSSRSSTEELERALRLVEAERKAAIEGAEFVELGD